MTDRTTPIDRAEAKAQVALWIDEEREQYATPKWEEENDALQEQNVRNGEWINFPFSYLNRCRMGLEHPAARQALGKNITSSMSLLERAVEIFGDMPKPGVSSTDGALPWVREPEPDVSGLVVAGPDNEELVGVICNAIGYAMFVRDGEEEVTISDDQLARLKDAAHRVLTHLQEYQQR